MSSDSPQQDGSTAGSSSTPPVAATNTSTATASVTLTKSGNISKMRSHRGNVPTLPQTKFCHLCPAKFTRTTHLNRHLKTHSNERLHECDRCNAQFTRSDLLSRHRRTCCDSSLANRSRRKSCQSCAESKVKCDLQRPCSRCKTKKRDCIYVNETVATAGAQSDTPPDPNQTDTSARSSPQPLRPSLSSVSTSYLPPSPIGAYPIATASRCPNSPPMPQDMPSSLSSISPCNAVGAREPTGNEKAYLSELLSSQLYDGLFSDVFTSSFEKNPVVPGQYFHPDPTTILNDRLELTEITSSNPYVPLTEMLSAYDNPQLDMTFPIDACGNLPTDVLQPSLPMPMPTVQPSASELNEYLMSFLSIFLHHMPIVHITTFLETRALPILVTAMQACGAMYTSTPTAAKFIEEVLANTRDTIIADLSSNNKSYDEITQLTLASALLQTIGIFHRDADQRARSNVYHGMIVMMLRMNGYVDRTRDWKFEQIDFSDPVATERAWRTWVAHESAKRAIWICYLHDCCHAIYFNLSPTFRTEQFTLGLPCEDALWTAKTAAEWAMILQMPSAYGSIEVRLCGHYLKALYFYLIQNNPDNSPRPFNVTPFAHFIMIHAMMRKLFEMYLRDRLPLLQPDSSGTRGVRQKVNPHFVDRDRVFHVQIMMHQWLQSWISSPETPRADQPEAQKRFLFNALPFYWVAQVSLVAYQEGLPPFDPEGTYITSHDAKFYLMKKWERHTRKFLMSGERTATKFWDEVMKIRIETWQAETGFEYEHLLGFFQRDHGPL
ncbi:fungal-specific transcription factor domain-containing protein [Lenzites betulinus]|nr:fungal-specific transcription factor domain-containing protein [Lenzites betulinus]